MYLDTGYTIEAKLGEAIGSINVDVVATTVDTSNTITVKTDQQLDGTTYRTIIDSGKGFVDEISIKNTDTITHSIIVRLNTGSVQREIVTLPLAPGSALIYKPAIGWQIQGAYSGSGWITSGYLGNNSVLSGAIASGQVSQFHIASGAVQSGHIGNNAVVSGSIASGQVFDFHFASGAKIDSSEFLVSDNIPVAEPVVGPLAVALNTSGGLVIAMAGQSGRFPAIGIVIDNVSSGQTARRFHKGRVYSTGWNLSGAAGAAFPIWLGLSGSISVTQPLPAASGLNQILGFGINNSGMTFEPSYIASGLIQQFSLSSGAVLSGAIASGQVIANHLASGAVRSGHVSSGCLSTNAIASGTVVTNSRWLVDDSIITEETISGVRAINVSQSGRARIAMAGVSGRMPAAGVVVANVASGQTLSIFSGTPMFVVGRTTIASGLVPTSGFGLFLYVGMSGNLVGPAALASGMLIQRVAVNASSGVASINVDGRVTSGQEPTFLGTF